MKRFWAAGVFLLLLFGFIEFALPQGMVSSGARAVPRAASSGRPFPVSFVDVASDAGLHMKFTSGNEIRKKYVIEANGSGVAFLDYDNDGLPDIFLVNGSRLEGFPGGQAPTNYLYRNQGNGHFQDVTKKAGLDHAGWGNGVCAADVDNDGNLDLYVTYWGTNVLYRNNGDGTFSDVTAKAGVGGPGNQWSTGCTFLDYDRDGHVDLLVTSYIDFIPEKTPAPGQFPFCMWKGAPVYCGPRGLPFGKATLYHNRGDGTFEDVSVKAGIRQAKDFYAFTAVAADLDGDGWTDIYIACDSTPSLYFRNNRDGTFRELATEAGIAYSEHGAEQAGMAVSVSDFDNDGRLDILKTNFTGDYPNLYRNVLKGFFSDIAVKAGLAVNPNHVVWGGGLVDLDNDGWKDIFLVTGHVYPEVQSIDPTEPYKGPRLVYRNLGNGKFEDVSAISGPAVMKAFSSRGAAFGDFDNDGDIDVLIMNMHEAPSLLRNDLKSANHWLKVRLQGTKSNRAAIGATVNVRAGKLSQTDPVLSQSSFLSHNDLRLHFGLGDAARVDGITVHWPSGDVEEFPGTAADGLVLLVEGTGKTQAVPLRK
jgi:enediyne biosynthesis protein E4